MGRPKLNQEDKKGKLGISISKELIKKLDLMTNNKSNLIEQIIISYLNKLK